MITYISLLLSCFPCSHHDAACFSLRMEEERCSRGQALCQHFQGKKDYWAAESSDVWGITGGPSPTSSPIKSEVSLTRFCSVGSISSTNLERLLKNGRSIQKKTPQKSGKDFLRDLGYPCSISKTNGCSSTGAGCCERQGWRAGAGWDCSLGSDRGNREGRTAEHWEEIC